MARELTGSVEKELVARLVRQVDLTRQGVMVARSAAVGYSDSVELDERMGHLEHGGDDERAALVAVLSSALMTPFDREDLFRVSRSIDEVLDNLQDFVRELALFGIHDVDFVLILDAVDASLAELGNAVAALTDRPQLVRSALAASKASNQVRRRYQERMAVLLEVETLSPEVMKRRELLRRLDVVGLRLGEAADALADGAVKRG
ncbi:DUF47 domain-containing protein [Egibacter rhizosphaerae]|uniref:DUF47 domain-containing protein n=1 Tax=Egibacter rhizosphaerae TaxID=1670831 RepID=UPI0013F161AB|nr:DUF47 family protein [Egibacter rhizosphaerae]